MTGKFKVSSGVALVSEQEFENFRLKIIDRCVQAVRDIPSTNVTAMIYREDAVATIMALKDKL